MGFLIRNIQLIDIPRLKMFKCDNQSMENFLFQEAYQSHVYGEGITKIVLSEEDIIAYYTLKCDAMKLEDPEMYPDPRYIPCIEVSRLAVAYDWQRGKKGTHLGTHLMGQIITLIREEISTTVGCRFITLHAVKEKVKWYQTEFDFKVWDDDLPDDQTGTVFMYLDLIDNNEVKEYLEYRKDTVS